MARRKRLKVNGGIFHLMSRTVDGEFLFEDVQKEQVRKMIGVVAEFSGVELLTYCVMSNHFHLLVRVPDGSKIVLSDEELVRRYRLLHAASEGKRKKGKAVKFAPDTPEQVEVCLQNGGADAQILRDRLRARMYDVSEFMKTLKQRISIWYNATHDRYGPLWCDRFKSVLVEGRKEVLLVMAAYIDLNPVRAGLVRDPKQYRFCGYAEALAGNEVLREGLRQVTGVTVAMGDWKVVLAEYRKLLWSAGGGAKAGKRRLEPQEVRLLLERGGGELGAFELLRHRLSYLVNGAMLGSESWVMARMASLGEDRSGEGSGKVKKLAGFGFVAGKRCRS